MRFRFVWAVVASFASFYVQAQDYPSKSVRLIIPWAAGGSTDSIGRILAQKLNEYTGQQWIVDNRAGATGTIGHALAAKAPPDGYTILLGTNSTFAIAPHLYKALQVRQRQIVRAGFTRRDQSADTFSAPVAAGEEREGAGPAREDAAYPGFVLDGRRWGDESHGY